MGLVARFGLILSCLALAACMTPKGYPPLPKTLIDIGPYPNPDDICRAYATPGYETPENHGVIGCPSVEQGAIEDRKRAGFRIIGQRGETALLQGPMQKTEPPKTAGDDGLMGRSFMFYDESHGTQVAYFTKDGREWLWYPGNQRALMGFYRFETRGGGKRICFRYPASSINPVTGVAGPVWECSSMTNHRDRRTLVGTGDVFGLSTGRIPFVMTPRKRYAIDALKAR